jgi:hypothetical protein
MSTQSNPPQAQPEPPTYTLAPLLAEGPDALDTRGTSELRRILLRKIAFEKRGAFRDRTIRQGNDLLPTAQPSNPVPQNATPVSATLGFKLTDATGTDAAEIIPPKTVKIRSAAHTQIILAWLAKSCFNAARKLAHLAPLLLLALATALGPTIGDLDTDDNDDDEESTPVHHHRRPRFHVSRFTFHVSRITHHASALPI